MIVYYPLTVHVFVDFSSHAPLFLFKIRRGQFLKRSKLGRSEKKIHKYNTIVTYSLLKTLFEIFSKFYCIGFHNPQSNPAKTQRKAFHAKCSKISKADIRLKLVYRLRRQINIYFRIV